jgi:hypothetical protein
MATAMDRAVMGERLEQAEQQVCGGERQVARIRVMIAEFGRQAHDVEPALAVLLRAHDSRPAARTVAVCSDPLKLLEARTSGEFADRGSRGLRTRGKLRKAALVSLPVGRSSCRLFHRSLLI